MLGENIYKYMRILIYNSEGPFVSCLLFCWQKNIRISWWHIKNLLSNLLGAGSCEKSQWIFLAYDKLVECINSQMEDPALNTCHKWCIRAFAVICQILCAVPIRCCHVPSLQVTFFKTVHHVTNSCINKTSVNAILYSLCYVHLCLRWFQYCATKIFFTSLWTHCWMWQKSFI